MTLIVYDDDVGLNAGMEREKGKKKNEKKDYYSEQYSLFQSVARTKRKILMLVRSKKWSYFVTLTFDPLKTDRYDYDLCCKRTRHWLQNLKRVDGVNELAFICIPEMHKDGAWHMHLLVDGIDPDLLKDSGKKNKGRKIYNLPNWQYGFSTVEKVDYSDPASTIWISQYVTKYITKESFMIAKHKHRYFASKNIPAPDVMEYTFYSEKDKAEFLADFFLGLNDF